MVGRHTLGMPRTLRLLATMAWVLILEDAGACADVSGADAAVPTEAPREVPAGRRGALPTLFGFGAMRAGSSHERAAAGNPETGSGEIAPEGGALA